MPSHERPQFSIRAESLEGLPLLAAELPAGEVLGALGKSAAPLIRVAGESGEALVSTLALRFALQDEPQREPLLGGLIDPSLCCPDLESANSKLAREPMLEAVVVAGNENREASVLQRDVPDIPLAIVMAGGLGSRLRPLTDETPKPLLEVGGRPLLFRILDDLAASGVRKVHISIHYLGDRVREAVGDGSNFGLSIDYLEETEPLDTGAGLAQLGAVDDPFFIVNGDILTGLDFRALGRFHRLSDSFGTVATYRFSAPLPYGVVGAKAHRIEGIQEKPVFEYPVNAGIYAFSPEASRAVEPGQPLAMVDFLNRHADDGRISRFPLVEDWSDVGSPQELARARAEFDEC